MQPCRSKRRRGGNSSALMQHSVEPLPLTKIGGAKRTLRRRRKGGASPPGRLEPSFRERRGDAPLVCRALGSLQLAVASRAAQGGSAEVTAPRLLPGAAAVDLRRDVAEGCSVDGPLRRRGARQPSSIRAAFCRTRCTSAGERHTRELERTLNGANLERTRTGATQGPRPTLEGTSALNGTASAPAQERHRGQCPHSTAAAPHRRH